jgi:signal peptidase I
MHTQEVGAGELLANLSIGYIILAAFVLTAIRLVLVPNRGAVARSVSELAESLILAGILVFLIIRPFFMQAFFIPTESMEPTLQGHESGFNPRTGQDYGGTVHDHIFVNKFLYRFRDPRRGEIVVFRAPKEADIEGGKKNENILIKRIVGIPGDTIQVKDGKVWRNGKPVDEPVCDDRAGNEPCIKEKMQPYQSGDAQFGVDQPLKLGPREYFVMGDNRNASWDSRFWGVVTRDRIIGKASFIFWPLNRIRLVH